MRMIVFNINGTIVFVNNLINNGQPQASPFLFG